MRWNRESRRRLAKIVWEKSVEIDNQVRSTARGVDNYMRGRDCRISAHFAPLGFVVAKPHEWVYDRSHNHPALFKPGRNHLFFLVCTQHVLKVEKELAAKMLVLGIP